MTMGAFRLSLVQTEWAVLLNTAARAFSPSAGIRNYFGEQVATYTALARETFKLLLAASVLTIILRLAIGEVILAVRSRALLCLCLILSYFVTFCHIRPFCHSASVSVSVCSLCPCRWLTVLWHPCGLCRPMSTAPTTTTSSASSACRGRFCSPSCLRSTCSTRWSYSESHFRCGGGCRKP